MVTNPLEVCNCDCKDVQIHIRNQKTAKDFQLQPQNGQNLVFRVTKCCRFTAVIQTHFILQLKYKVSVNVCLGS